jgi:hypothetical protein
MSMTNVPMTKVWLKSSALALSAGLVLNWGVYYF